MNKTKAMPSEDLARVLADAGACRRCRGLFGHDPRPVLRAAPIARLLIVGQAPGTRVHETGIPWNDPSGDRLRDWLDMDRDAFYDEGRIAIVPMGLCYPGRDESGGDKPPPTVCAETWHPAVLAALTQIRLTLLVGAYAQGRYLGKRKKKSMTETVRAWGDYAPGLLPLPHPSWRNTGWLKRNPWFETDLIPELRDRVRRAFD